MERREADAAAAKENEVRLMVACELEAAEALASFSAASGGASMSRLQHVVEAVVASQVPKDQTVAAESTTIASPEKAEKIVAHIHKELCRTSVSSNSPMKLRRKLTEAEKEERKTRRVMANRESARQTIRRRQAMRVELIGKAEAALEESENLKKQKEQMVEEYNSLKGRNDFLKAQLARAKKVATREAEDERNSSDSDRLRSTTTASTSVFLQTRPSVVPCMWPSIVPSSDAFPFQNASHLPCSNQGQGFSTENPRRGGAPLFIVPVPWLFPLVTQSSSDKTHCHHCGKCQCCEANQSNDMPSSQNSRADSDGGPHQTIVVPGLFSPVRPRETVEAPRRSQGVVMCSHRKAEDVFAAAEARRRRKEMMKLKNVHSARSCC